MGFISRWAENVLDALVALGPTVTIPLAHGLLSASVAGLMTLDDCANPRKDTCDACEPLYREVVVVAAIIGLEVIIMMLMMGGSYAVWRSKGWGAGGARWWGGPGKWIAVYFLCAVVPMRSVAECLKMLVDYEAALADSVSNAALGRKLMQCKIPVGERAAVGSCASFHENATATQGGVPPFIMGLALKRALIENAFAVGLYLSMVAAWWAVMWVVAFLREWAHKPKPGAGVTVKVAGNKAVHAEAVPDVSLNRSAAETPVVATQAEPAAEPAAEPVAEPAAAPTPPGGRGLMTNEGRLNFNTRSAPEITPAEHQPPSGIVDELASLLPKGVSGKLAEASTKLQSEGATSMARKGFEMFQNAMPGAGNRGLKVAKKGLGLLTKLTRRSVGL